MSKNGFQACEPFVSEDGRNSRTLRILQSTIAPQPDKCIIKIFRGTGKGGRWGGGSSKGCLKWGGGGRGH